PNGTEIEISYKVGENLYKFSSEITGKKLDNIPLYRILKPIEKKIYRIQRRENFRVNLHLKLVLLENEYTTVNVSAGGLLFSGPGKLDLKEGQPLTGQVLVPNVQAHDLEFITFHGEIRRVYQSEDKTHTFVAVEFTEISPKDQTIIVQSCFEQQRKMRLRTNS
ncbi:MAG: PilZ domain-containing protein, partial [Bacillus sp. (in: firmicutes)]